VRKFVSGALFLSLSSLLFLFPLASESEAIPAFAREHKIACSFCHVGFPKLNSIRNQFQAKRLSHAGHQRHLPVGETDPPVGAGQLFRTQLFPNATGTGSLAQRMYLLEAVLEPRVS